MRHIQEVEVVAHHIVDSCVQVVVTNCIVEVGGNSFQGGCYLKEAPSLVLVRIDIRNTDRED